MDVKRPCITDYCKNSHCCTGDTDKCGKFTREHSNVCEEKGCREKFCSNRSILFNYAGIQGEIGSSLILLETSAIFKLDISTCSSSSCLQKVESSDSSSEESDYDCDDVLVEVDGERETILVLQEEV